MTHRYRIAFIFQRIHQGGAEQIIFNLTRGLQKLGHLVSYYSLQPPTFQLDNDLPIPYVPKKLGNKLLSKWLGSSQLRRKIKRDQEQLGHFDLILSNRRPFLSESKNTLFYFLHNDTWGQLKAKYPGYPKQCSLLHLIQGCAQILRTRRYFKNKRVIAVSKGAQAALIEKIKAKPSSICTIYNPFDFAWIQHQSEAYKPDITEPYLIHVGRFDPQKRHDLLFDAYRRLQNPPKLVLLVAITEPLTAMIAQYGLTHQVILPGLQANPFPWIKGAKALILSSDFEALPTVLIESLICDTPVVSTDCPSGPNEILTGDLAHWLVPVNEPIALAHKIQEVLDHPYSINLDQIRQFDMSVVLPQYLALRTTRT